MTPAIQEEKRIQRHNEKMMRVAQRHWHMISRGTLYYAMKFGMINIVPPERKKRKP